MDSRRGAVLCCDLEGETITGEKSTFANSAARLRVGNRPGAPAAPPILFADARFVVLNKPAGLPAHAGRAGGPSVEDWFPALSRRREGPWLVHRLDRDTAGCLLVALRRAALLEAQAAFAARRVGKTYWAVVRGRPPGEAGTLDLPLRKVSGRDGWHMAGGPRGQQAVTDWRVLGSGAGMAWLELHPRTGRTHQVRAHCAALGCPVVGDAVYGDGGGPLLLLARAISVPLTPPVAAVAPVPAPMRKALDSLGALQLLQIEPGISRRDGEQ